VIDGTTRVFAILGDPLAHSLSPTMHNAAFQALGLPATYVPLRCSDDDLPRVITALTRAGGGGNVTVPHKEAAARAVDRCLSEARLLGACNTFWGDEAGSVGENTDVAGIGAALDALEAPSGSWLVLGTGGGARAVVGAAKARGVAVAAVSRSAERWERFQAWAQGIGVPEASADDCTVVINTTPLGLEPGQPLPLERPPHRAAVALDMVYARGETAWVRAMRSAGLRAGDGRVMLVAQGAASFRCWFPRLSPPADLMRGVVDAALR
jgi:shikimate dehydrogenase